MNPLSPATILPVSDSSSPKKHMPITVEQVTSPSQSSSGAPAAATLGHLTVADLLNHYKNRATALLAVSTFAATITFSIILTPRDSGQATPGLAPLAYANSLFCGAIVGCVFVVNGLEIVDMQQTMINVLKTKLDVTDDTGSRAIFHWYNTIAEIERVKDAINKKCKGELRKYAYKLLLLSHHMWIPIVRVVASFVGLSLFVGFYLMIYVTRLFLQYDGPFILGTTIYMIIGILAIVAWTWYWLLEYLSEGLSHIREDQHSS